MKTKTILAIAATGLLTACGNVDSSHLIFGQQHVVGLSIGGSVPEQGGALTLGLRDLDIAIIPVAIKNEDGTYEMIKAETYNPTVKTTRYKEQEADSLVEEKDGKITDSFSTIGNFELKGAANTGGTGTANTGGGAASTVGPSVGLGKFFATGNAAQILADGFRTKLSK